MSLQGVFEHLFATGDEEKRGDPIQPPHVFLVVTFCPFQEAAAPPLLHAYLCTPSRRFVNTIDGSHRLPTNDGPNLNRFEVLDSSDNHHHLLHSFEGVENVISLS